MTKGFKSIGKEGHNNLRCFLERMPTSFAFVFRHNIFSNQNFPKIILFFWGGGAMCRSGKKDKPILQKLTG